MSWFGFIVGFLALLYGAVWWYGKDTHPIQYGLSFSPGHAEWLTGDWQRVYRDMLSDLAPPFIRISADWDRIESVEGVYDFSEVDFMFEEALTHDTQVLLAFGQKTPRWPECHAPSWVGSKTPAEYEERLRAYVTAVVERYKNHRALEYWQVENEPFIHFEFGSCEQFAESLVDEEIRLTRSLDPDHRIVVTDSGELSLWYRASRAGDIFGTTMYRVVRTPGNRVVSYEWLPLGWYRLRAAVLGMSADRFFISELQAEPWTTESILTTPIDEQMETMDISRMRKNLEAARHAGASRAYLWGVEWWYFMKYTHSNEEFVTLAKEYIEKR